MLPNAEIKYRRGLDLKKIIPQAMERDFTDILVVNEDRKEPSILFIHSFVGSFIFEKITNGVT